MKLINYRYAQPIERMRGGNVVLAIEAQFKDGLDYYTVSYFKLIETEEKELENKLHEAEIEILKICKDKAEELATIKGNENYDTIIQHLLKPFIAVNRTKYPELDGEPTDAQQEEVTKFCDILGITNINLKLGNISYDAKGAAALIKELQNLSKKSLKIEN